VLQIISGKFFQSGELNERLHRYVFYTNYRSFHGDELRTSVGRLIPSTAMAGLATMMCEVVERLEALTSDGQPSVLISTGGEQLMDDFAAVVSFALNITCTLNPDITRRLTAPGKGLQGSEVPQKYLRRVFDAEVRAKDGDGECLATFIDNLIALDRQTFEGAMRAIRRYVLGTHRIADEISLAYVLFVMSIESLAQGFDGHVPVWTDYDIAKRKRIDKALENVSPADAAKVRSAVLANEHVALGRRFREFTLQHITPPFFREEAADAIRPISKIDLPYALKKAYEIRSRHVHQLEELPRNIWMSADRADTAWLDGRPVLAFQGIARLARHVIFEFVQRGKKIDNEHFRYRDSLPGVVKVPLAPQYWVSRPEGFNAKTARRRLEGSLEEIATALTKPGSAITDLSPLLEKIEHLVPTLNEANDRLPLLTIYVLFHCFAAKKFHRSDSQEFVDQYASDFKPPSVEALAMHLAIGRDLPWELDQLTALHSSYVEQRDQRGGLRMGALFEAAFLLCLAERHRMNGDTARAREVIAEAVEVHPSHTGLRNYEASIVDADLPPIRWVDILLPPSESKDKAGKPSDSASN